MNLVIVKLKTKILFLILCIPSLLWAQESDFGTWWSIGTSHDISKKLELNIEGALRTDKNSSHLKTSLIESGISREFFKFIDLSVNYRFSYNDNNEVNYTIKHRLYSDLKAKVSYNDFDFSTRLRYQREYEQNREKITDELPEEYIRLKFGIDYDWPSSPYNPYTSVDFYYPLDQSVSVNVEKKRIQCGIEYKMRKKRSLKAGFLYQEDIYPSLSHYYGLVFAFNFPL